MAIRSAMSVAHQCKAQHELHGSLCPRSHKYVTQRHGAL